MEPQFMRGFDVGTPPHGVAIGGGGGQSSSDMHLPRSVLRIVALVLAFVSAAVMGAAKETVTLLLTDTTTGFTSSYIAIYKSTYSAAYVYFVVANALVFVYSLVALVVSMARRGSYSSVALPLAVADLVMVAFLFSGNGAAAAISVVSEKGQINFGGWEQICNVASKFCGRANAAIVLSMVASLAYVLLVVLGVITIHKTRA